MSRSGQSSRSTSSYSSGKIPLSYQTGSKQSTTYDSARYDERYIEPRYTTSLSEPLSGSSSKSSSSTSGRSSKPEKKPLSISRGSSSRDEGRSKTDDERYYVESFLDPRKPKKSPSYQTKDRDVRYYPNSSYYR